MGEAVDESLKHLLGLSEPSELSRRDPVALGFGTKAGQVEETAIASGVKIRSVL